MRLYVIDLGRCDVDKGAVLTPGSGDGVRIFIPIVSYLIQTDEGANILIDTGIYGHDPVQWATLRKAPEYYD